MKKFILFLLFAVCGTAAAQDTAFVCAYKCEITFSGLKASCPQAQSIISAVSLSAGSVNPYTEFQQVVDLLKSMDTYHTFPLLYSFKPCPVVCNAASVTIDSLQYIYYNQDFLNKIKGDSEKQKWAIRCIIIHEIGHHVLGHTFPGYKPPTLLEQRKNELRADHFSAFVIKHFPSATFEDACEGLNTLDAAKYEPRTAAQEELKTYPLLASRYQAVKEGFDSLSDQITLSMYKNILDSVAKKYYKKYRRSILYNILNETLLSGKLKDAELMLNEIKLNDPEFFDRYNLKDSEKLIRKKIEALNEDGGINQMELSPEEIKQIKKVEIKVLQDDSKQLDKRIPSERIESERIQQQVDKMKREQRTRVNT